MYKKFFRSLLSTPENLYRMMRTIPQHMNLTDNEKVLNDAAPEYGVSWNLYIFNGFGSS